MTNWPSSYDGAFTLAGVTSRNGIGLHSGLNSEITLLPSEETGFHVSWLGSKELPVTISPLQVEHSQLCTTLNFGERKLSTVEHLFSALAGCGVTNVEIRVSGDEVPLLDGSALPWVEAIAEVGLRQLTTSSYNLLEINDPISLNRGSSVIIATPSEQFTLVGVIEFPYRAIGKQIFSIALTPKNFVQEIAPARTFGFLDQVEQLRSLGLIKGASLNNALVCDGDNWVNPPLRFEDEPVRHKLLDLIGDLAIVGFPKAQVLVYKGSHGLHTDFAAALLALSKAQSS